MPPSTRQQPKSGSSLHKKLYLRWEERFQQLKLYKSEHGDCTVPRHYEKIPGLANWVYRQRELHKKGKLNPDRIKLLKEIEFKFEIATGPKVDNETWVMRYEELLEFKIKSGSYIVPRDGSSLGNWVKLQRVMHAKGELSKERFQMLDKLHGFFWKRTQEPSSSKVSSKGDKVHQRGDREEVQTSGDRKSKSRKVKKEQKIRDQGIENLRIFGSLSALVDRAQKRRKRSKSNSVNTRWTEKQKANEIQQIREADKRSSPRFAAVQGAEDNGKVEGRVEEALCLAGVEGHKKSDSASIDAVKEGKIVTEGKDVNPNYGGEGGKSSATASSDFRRGDEEEVEVAEFNQQSKPEKCGEAHSNMLAATNEESERVDIGMEDSDQIGFEVGAASEDGAASGNGGVLKDDYTGKDEHSDNILEATNKAEELTFFGRNGAEKKCCVGGRENESLLDGGVTDVTHFNDQEPMHDFKLAAVEGRDECSGNFGIQEEVNEASISFQNTAFDHQSSRRDKIGSDDNKSNEDSHEDIYGNFGEDSDEKSDEESDEDRDEGSEEDINEESNKESNDNSEEDSDEDIDEDVKEEQELNPIKSTDHVSGMAGTESEEETASNPDNAISQNRNVLRWEMTQNFASYEAGMQSHIPQPFLPFPLQHSNFFGQHGFEGGHNWLNQTHSFNIGQPWQRSQLGGENMPIKIEDDVEEEKIAKEVKAAANSIEALKKESSAEKQRVWENENALAEKIKRLREKSEAKFAKQNKRNNLILNKVSTLEMRNEWSQNRIRELEGHLETSREKIAEQERVNQNLQRRVLFLERQADSNTEAVINLKTTADSNKNTCAEELD